MYITPSVTVIRQAHRGDQWRGLGRGYFHVIRTEDVKINRTHILAARALVSFGQRLKRGTLGTLLSKCRKIHDIR